MLFSKPARLGKGIGVVCLEDNEYDLPINKHSKCYITGWGKLSSGGGQPDVLMQASVPLVSKEKCLKTYPNQIDDSMLCAGLDKGGVDACQGDSGGPLVCEHHHHWYLEGATSWGWGCAKPGKYGVYAKVRHFRRWIMDTIAPGSGMVEDDLHYLAGDAIKLETRSPTSHLLLF